MLLEFSVSNFLSLKDRTTINFNTTSVVLYGANASGKSNLLKAMIVMRDIVLQYSPDVIPFLLNEATEHAPSTFEVVLLLHGIKYRYGFKSDNDRIQAEWLFETRKQKEKELFTRENAPGNLLFITEEHGKIARGIVQWFNNLCHVSGQHHKHIITEILKDKKRRPLLMDLYQKLQLGFDNLSFHDIPFEKKELPEDLPDGLVKQLIIDFEDSTRTAIKTIHKKYDAKGQAVGTVEFDMNLQESAGTYKLLYISGYVLDALYNGGVLIIDELDAGLHPFLRHTITQLFNSSEFNTANAQLIFSIYDVHLLQYGSYRKDQVYLVQKDKFGVSSIQVYEEETAYKADAIPFTGNKIIQPNNN